MTGTTKTLKRTAALMGAALLVGLASAPQAGAGFKQGRYSGATSEREPISFKATKNRVKKLTYALLVECGDGSSWKAIVTDGSTRVTRNGRFRLEVADGGSTSLIIGRLKRRRASGSIETISENPANRAGPGCSGAVEWSARREQQRAAADPEGSSGD